MNTKYCIFTCLALTLAACVDDDTLQTTENKSIKLDVVQSNMISRAVGLYDSANPFDQFKVWAFTTEQKTANNKTENEDGETVDTTPTSTYVEYIPAEDVSKSDGSSSWNFDSNTTYFWPKYDSLDFFAIKDNTDFVPAIGRQNNYDEICRKDVTDGTAKKHCFEIVNYIVDDSPEQQGDLMYAAKLNQSRPASEADNDPVQLNFHHALAAIDFKVVNETYSTFIQIAQIRVCKVYRNGDFYFTEDQTNDAGETVVGGYWDFTPYPTSREYLHTPFTADETQWKTAFLRPLYQGESVTSPNDNPLKPSYTYDGKQTMMMIPQPVEMGDVRDLSAITGNYLMILGRFYNVNAPETFNNKLKELSADGITASSIAPILNGTSDSSIDCTELIDSDTEFTQSGKTIKLAVIYVPLPELKNGWQAGKHYTYTITFNENTSQFEGIQIDVTSTVEDWVNGGYSNNNNLPPSED